MIHKLVTTSSGAIATAFGSAVCCAGPTVAAAAGASGAFTAQLATFQPFRPFFVIAAFGFLWLGFDRLDKQERECAEGDACANPSHQKRQRTLLRIATAMVLLFTSSPIWIDWVL